MRLALLFRILAPMRNRDNMRLVAEGVEEKAELEFLRNLKCNLGQGYLFAAATPATEALRLAHERAWPAIEGFTAGAELAADEPLCARRLRQRYGPPHALRLAQPIDGRLVGFVPVKLPCRGPSGLGHGRVPARNVLAGNGRVALAWAVCRPTPGATLPITA